MALYTDLATKVVVITGASGDIGLAICKKYLDSSSRVYAIYNSSPSSLDELIKTHESGHLLSTIKCDITNPVEVEHLVSQIESDVDHIDILINNAGMCKDNLFSLMNFDDFDQVIKTNLYGTFNMCKAMLRLLRHSKQANIVNVSSVAGLTASKGQSNYSAAKAGINGLTRTLAAEFAAKGVRINAVAPGLIESRMVKKIPRQITREIMDVIPLKRLGRVDEIANVVAFLSSESSSYIVGQTLVADGGLVMH